jgi:putative DNA primase/helicase
MYVSPSTCAAAASRIAHCKRHHPIKEFFDNLPRWDGTLRLDAFPETYLGTPAVEEKVPYIRAVFPCWMISAVARTMDPGCKVDHMLLLLGKQGIGKSTLAKTLAVNDAWFADEIGKIGWGKDAAETLKGKVGRGDGRAECLQECRLG